MEFIPDSLDPEPLLNQHVVWKVKAGLAREMNIWQTLRKVTFLKDGQRILTYRRVCTTWRHGQAYSWVKPVLGAHLAPLAHLGSALLRPLRGWFVFGAPHAFLLLLPWDRGISRLQTVDSQK